MNKSEEMLRLERDMNEQPELREKLEAECRRIAEAGEAQSDGELMVKAATALGYTIPLEELERSVADVQELDLDELNDAAGGYHINHDEKGHDTHCWTVWHCYVASMHTESKEKLVACLADYNCVMALKHEYLRTLKPRKYDD